MSTHGMRSAISRTMTIRASSSVGSGRSCSRAFLKGTTTSTTPRGVEDGLSSAGAPATGTSYLSSPSAYPPGPSQHSQDLRQGRFTGRIVDCPCARWLGFRHSLTTTYSAANYDLFSARSVTQCLACLLLPWVWRFGGSSLAMTLRKPKSRSETSSRCPGCPFLLRRHPQRSRRNT